MTTLEAHVPHDRSPDSTLAVWRDGYGFISKRCRRYGSDAFRTRILGQRAICLHGPKAAHLFYDATRFERRDAVPKRVQKTLTGERGVQTLDGAAHQDRKRMFMSLMTPASVDALVQIVVAEWRDALDRWAAEPRVILFDEVQRLLCRSVCKWAGVPLGDDDVVARAGDLGVMVDGFGGAGPRNWRGRRARRRCEAWIAAVVDDVRAGRLETAAGTATAVIARHRDPAGRLLDRQVAAVELLNVLRPVVAIATYVTFAALALHDHPESRERIRSGDEEAAELFVQEVRRFYPFTPFLGARVRSTFEWHGQVFEQGTLVLLDVFGTLHDPELWDRPDLFEPERFREWNENSFDFIPQGGGDYQMGHRCAGEWITIALVKAAVQLLAGAMDYNVPAQDLRVSLHRIPTLPRSRFLISHVRNTVAAGPP